MSTPNAYDPAVETLIKRLHARVPDSVLEQAAIAGAFAQGAGDKEAQEAAARLNRIAEEGDMSLIVMGGIGATGLERFLLGSVADKVVRSSKIPVLVVRKE